ncbi:dipeptidase [Ensifer adhaerens]|uniref:dipeptidase n=1 Tax=Ensifer adhaerens TaxID=106592 RepID=UPI000FDCA1A6|nr:dipeptidase [Ensifer adhaerens]MDF8358022.1 dipeptidase [Ensifer adhaerens]THA61588.1 membrane dipeptidase [Ensifer adhaerens]
MATQAKIPVFDGHNDVLSRLWRSPGGAAERRFLDGVDTGHIDLDKAAAGGLAGGLCAVYVASPGLAKDGSGEFATPDQQSALEATLGMTSLLMRIERQSEGRLKICRSAADIRAAMDKGAFASVLHIEGIEAVGADLDVLYVLHAAGLRTLGPVWSRPNLFAYGVPFRFPSSPDIGPGLSEAGKDLVRACNELKIMLDLSHMNEQGFWDIAALSQAPLVASHSNVHALCPHSRNLTDRQLDAIRDTGGLAGINFGVLFLRADGTRNTDTPLSLLVDHIDYIVERIGIDHVALGSDFDGTAIPAAMRSAADLPLLVDLLRTRGYDDAALAKICHGNWIRVLETSWGG